MVKSIMKRAIKFILVFLAVLLAGGSLFALPAKAAENDLVVEYLTDTGWKKWLPGEDSFPIFEEGNFLPGDTATSLVKVTNNTNQPQNIAIEAIRWPGFPNPEDVPDRDLSRALEITISQDGGSDIYGGSAGKKTLFNFYQDGEVLLTEGLAGNGGQVIYNFQISFPKEEENQWQGATTTFDILIGFQGTEGGGGTGGGGTGGGGGGGGLPPGLTIQYERTRCISDTTVIIEWVTSYKSTSRVIYSTTSGTFDLSAGEPNYGYPFWTEEKDNTPPIKENGVTYHTVALTGLTPSTTYYYRCVSHASPPTISRERSFTTLALGEGKPCVPCKTPSSSPEAPTGAEEGAEESPEEGEEAPAPPIAEVPTRGAVSEQPPEEPSVQPKEEGEKVIMGEQGEVQSPLSEKEEKKSPGIVDLTKFLAAIGDFFTLKNSCLLLSILAIILTVLFILSRKKKKQEEKKYEEKKYMDLIVALLVLVVLIILFKCLYLLIPILLLIGCLIYEILKKKKKKPINF